MLLCVISPKVHDSSVWLGPGASAVFTVQCGDPAAKPPYLQPEKQRRDGSSEEDADQEVQAALVAQALLLHQGWELHREDAGRDLTTQPPLCCHNGGHFSSSTALPLVKGH